LWNAAPTTYGERDCSRREQWIAELPEAWVPQLNVALVPAPDQVVVRLTGDADLSTTPLVTDALARAAGLRTRQVLVDLARARFWDASVLRALAQFTAELAADGRACRIVGALPGTRRLIGMANLAGRLLLDGPLRGCSDAAHEEPDGVPARRPVSDHPVPAQRFLPVRTGV
jgi:anti-anti-sigma factor